MTKVVINNCFGGFGLSDKAKDLYAKKKGFKLFRYKELKSSGNFIKITEKDNSLFIYSFIKDLGDNFNASDWPKEYYWSDSDIERTDPALIEVVEELGEEANNKFAKLRVVDIPDDIDWYIDDYDGNESIREYHRSWS